MTGKSWYVLFPIKGNYVKNFISQKERNMKFCCKTKFLINFLINCYSIFNKLHKLHNCVNFKAQLFLGELNFFPLKYLAVVQNFRK